MNTKKLNSWISLILIISTYFGMLAPLGLQNIEVVNAQKVSGKPVQTKQNMNQTLPNGLQFRLSEGVEGAEKREVKPQVKTDLLSESETSNLLKRIPAIKTEEGDQTNFAKRNGSLPAPKTGKQIPVKFPASENRPVIGTETLSRLDVVRYSPEGALPIISDLNVTFSQPMVAVTSQEEAAQSVPVQLSPQPEGKWRWLGTKTLMFDTAKRFPMATKYTATVPAGTKAPNGATLQKAVSWTFSTPPPKVEMMIPQNQTTVRNPLMFVSFDQEINPEAVIKTISITAQGKKIPIRLATAEEIDKDGSISYYVKSGQPKRWLAFRALNSDGLTENALPGDSAVTVTVEKGTPSAEGPLTSTEAKSFSFRTFGAMKFTGGSCSYNSADNKCSPFADWYVSFTNQIDVATFDKSQIKIEPPIENAKIFASGNYIYVQGYKKGRTTYKLSMSGTLKDIYGQTLENAVNATFNVGSADRQIYSQGGNFVILDPTAKPFYSIYSTNHTSVKVKVYKVTPEDWEGYRLYMRHLYYDEQKQPKMPGRLIVDKVLTIQNKPDEMVETGIDLSGALDDGFGHAIVVVEPTVRRDKYDRTKIVTWCQSTQIGLDAFVDNEELVGWATELKTGKPLVGVELLIYPNGKTPSGQQQAVEENGKSWWEWLNFWGSSESAETATTEVVEENGETTETETVNPAQSNRTGENGILRLPLPEYQANKTQNVLIARRGKDVAFMPEQSDYYWQEYGSWYKRSLGSTTRWFVFDDRKMYRPKEEVSVKGYLREVSNGKNGDVQGVNDTASKVTYRLTDARGNEILKGETSLNAFGAFDLKFKLTDNMNLGNASLQLGRNGNYYEHYHNFQVQEFRRPEFEVSSKVESEAPHFVKGKADVAVEAKYFAGGGLANAEVNWTVTATPTNYTPPNRGDFTFGKWFPWWRNYDDNYGYGGLGYYEGGQSVTQSYKGVTDAVGKHRLKIDFESVNPPRPYIVSAASSVQDVNRQTWSSSTSLLVHPSALYVGLKTNRNFVNKGQIIEVDSIVSDIDGKLIGGREVTIKAVLKDWTFDKGSWKEEIVDEQICTINSGDKPEKCKFTAKQGGTYTITANVMDDRERANQTEFTVWVSGGRVPPKRNVEQEEVQLIPNKKDYTANEVAEVLVMSPFAPAEGVLTLRREGLVKTERFTMKDSTTVLKIPIEEKYLPNIHLQVNLVGAGARLNEKGEVDEKIAKRPAFAAGNLNLSISTASRKLTVSAEPQQKTLEPAGETKIDVEVKDYRGEPVGNSEVAVVVVDESVLSLTGYRVGNPLDTFYTQRGTGVNDYHLRKNVLLGNNKDIKPQAPQENEGRVMAQAEAVGASSDMVSAKPSAAPSPAKSAARSREVSKDKKMERDEADDRPAEQNNDPINLRTNFNALAVWSPNVKTDSNGKAVIPVKLPDNLTRYRVMAVSVDNGKRFGSGESAITARQPLMVRPSAPRFMNFGDKIELPVVVQNQTDNPMTVDVFVRATNAELTAGGGRKVVIPANDRAEVRFPVSAVKAGTARFQIGVSSGKWSDAAEVSLPVWTPATSEAFATYGSIDESGAIVQPVQTPKDVYSQFGGLEITTSSTQLQELTDSFIYLYRYPYECSEQISSRMISIAALKDILSAFKAKDMPTADEIQKSFAKDIEILRGRQRDDGSFGLWGRARQRYEYPFLTIHVAQALALAKAKGYQVPDEMINKTKPYLKNIEKHFDEWHRKSPEVRWTISAYSLYIRNLMGDRDAAKAKSLLKEATIEKMPFEALGWILSVLADDKNSEVEVQAILRFLMNRTTETASTANFITDYGDNAWLIMYSNRRADGVLLEALIKADKNNDLIPKLVKGLLAHRTKGHWSNTQENVFILLAMDKYFNTFEKVTPDFVSRAWLGNTFAGEQVFKGRSVDSNVLSIPMNYLTEQGGSSNLILDKQGQGRLYYRIGMKYAPKNLKLAPADYGFTVLRKYEAVDNPEDVKQDADGTWRIKAGSRVRVKLTMVAQARRYHVALVDPLPAGLEILNPELAVTEAIPNAPNSETPVIEYGSRSYGRGWYYWRWQWFEHQNFRDERAEAFCSLLWEGVYNYNYVARATTPGEFVVPPAKAEEMYMPETFGRSGTDFVKVE